MKQIEIRIEKSYAGWIARIVVNGDYLPDARFRATSPSRATELAQAFIETHIEG